MEEKFGAQVEINKEVRNSTDLIMHSETTGALFMSVLHYFSISENFSLIPYIRIFLLPICL